MLKLMVSRKKPRDFITASTQRKCKSKMSIVKFCFIRVETNFQRKIGLLRPGQTVHEFWRSFCL